jgi:hypothetical protein
MGQQYPLINGVKYDWASVEITFGDAGIFIGTQELTYSDTNDKGIVRGTGVEKLARTLGEYDAEGTVTMYEKDYLDFIASLTNNGETGYFDTSFDITVMYSAPGGDGNNQVRLIGCQLKSSEGGGSQGTDPLMESYDLDIMHIERDGILPFTNMLV